jgi:hypothetical protein
MPSNLTQHVSLLTRSRPHIYRQAIGHRNRIKELKAQQNHELMQVKSQTKLLQQKIDKKNILTASRTFYQISQVRDQEASMEAQ